jgi:hypothetical protein
MNRAKIRKLLDTLPKGLPERELQRALSLVRNPAVRGQLEARYRAREAGR